MEPEILYFDTASFRRPNRFTHWWRQLRRRKSQKKKEAASGNQKRVDNEFRRFFLDGQPMSYRSGAWTVWIPGISGKFLYSVDGRVHCIYPTAPSREFIFSPSLDLEATDATGHYTWKQWRAAYKKPVVQRVAELYVATERLHRAGLGPRPLGFCFARHNEMLSEKPDTAGAWGLLTEDASKLPTRQPPTEAEMLDAGVAPDSIRSCVRQPVNGYIIDLNSVLGVEPIDAKAEIETLETYLRKATGAQ